MSSASLSPRAAGSCSGPTRAPPAGLRPIRSSPSIKPSRSSAARSARTRTIPTTSRCAPWRCWSNGRIRNTPSPTVTRRSGWMTRTRSPTASAARSTRPPRTTTRRWAISTRSSGSGRRTGPRITTAGPPGCSSRTTTGPSPTSTRPSSSIPRTRRAISPAPRPGWRRTSKTRPSPIATRPSGSIPRTPMLTCCAPRSMARSGSSTRPSPTSRGSSR